MGTARVTYIIDESGVISEVIEKVDTKNHASQILDGAVSSKASAPVPKKVAAPKIVKLKKPIKKTAPKRLKKAIKKKK